MKNSIGKRKLIVGADEAGYGPNLGPLVVAVSAWEVHSDLSEAGFLSRVDDLFSSNTYEPGCTVLPVADSKKLYSTQSGVQTLESGLLSMLRCAGLIPQNLAELTQSCGNWPLSSKMPWYQSLEGQQIPVEQDPAEVVRLAGLAKTHLDTQEIELLRAQFYLTTETEFNKNVVRLGSKGQYLSLSTLELITNLLITFDGQYDEIEVFC
ncbi:MAG: hypothetical protein AAF483_17870, partial [Planctomycetota bacterium]